ncbi:MAG TPA: hypothetical protein VGH82_14125 [Gaiellaceae bacterium]
MIAAAPIVAVQVSPTHELRTASPVNEIAVDGGRAATLVGEPQQWEYMLVWTPKGIALRATLSCDTQESNVVLAANDFAHLCYQGRNYVVTGTVRPLTGRVALRASGGAVISLSGQDTLVVGSVSTLSPKLTTVIWQFDQRAKRKLHAYAARAVVLCVDHGRILVDRPHALDVLSRGGAVVASLRRPQEGGAVLRDGRVATISGRRLVVTGIDGRRAAVRMVAAGAHLDDVGGRYVLYSVETRLHLLRLSDGKDIVLRLRNQFGYVHARLWGGAIFYSYNQRSGRMPGHAGYVDAAGVRALLKG